MRLQITNIMNSSEFARVYGVELFSVISRGSQFKVESMMLRLARPENFIALSPSRRHVVNQRAAECLPLVMEPRSGYYKAPVIVLDFQSLYPSIMIAYNYCFSTCLGRLSSVITCSDQPTEARLQLGVCQDFQINPRLLAECLGDDWRGKVTIAPNGVVFVRPKIRISLLRKMLIEILETRFMIKRSMGRYSSDRPSLKRQLDARQLGLKLLANVTYGYTSASFSGRMPCVDIADSIVQTGRETLEKVNYHYDLIIILPRVKCYCHRKTIKTINETERWGAEVVYGDTDSVFVHLPNASGMKEAFQVGQDIADTISAMFPNPMRLRFEKVYNPCILLIKKRYVGMKYERPDQTEPQFDAKGIETVRRDGCPLVSKMLETSLKYVDSNATYLIIIFNF